MRAWALRAMAAAQRVAPVFVLARRRFPTARRAEWAWTTWDEEEIQRELTSWKRLVE